MRLEQVYIDGFKNLKDVTINFEKGKLTTVIIGQNGSGKSNLIEAITSIFRWVDLRRNEPRFRYCLLYRIDGARVKLSNLDGKSVIEVNGTEVMRAEFERRKPDWFPDLVFGYFSGSGRRLESFFDSHQRRYYDDIKREEDEEKCAEALQSRRLFYCRPIHGILALLSFLAFPDPKVQEELKSKLGIMDGHSALFHFREPWFAKGGADKKIKDASNFWGATGPAGRAAMGLKAVAFHPLSMTGNAIDDYRDKQQSEAQYAAFLPDMSALRRFSNSFANDREMFFALESLDISDLIRDVYLWINRTNDATGDVSFSDLSDGERQLLMVLGLIRVSRGKRALFLLDEPDTHLNPHWQHSYLQLIESWTGITADSANCHIILTSHNPLTISALTRDEVRVINTDESGKTTVVPPYVDPRGMGFTATLTEIFGLSSSLDIETQKLLDERNALVRLEKKSDDQSKALSALTEKIDRLGFLTDSREPLYQAFLRALHDVRYADRPALTQAQLEDRHNMMKEIIKGLLNTGASH